MDRDRLLLGLAAVFAGLTTLLSVVALAEQPFLLLLAVPFAATTYFLWYHVSGRLEARARTRARRTVDPSFEGGRPGPGARDPRGRASAGAGGRVGGGRTRRTAGRSRSNGGREFSNGPSRAEAYRTLGLEPDAGQEAIRRAYRDKVKTAHPDTESGDEETFRRINRAYERLSE